MSTAGAAAQGRWQTAGVQVLAGLDAGLVATCLALLYALVAYGPLGPAALPIALHASAAAFVVGGLVAAWIQGGRVTISGPTATGALVVAAMLGELQGLDGAAGRIEPAIVAVAATGVITAAVQGLMARLRLGVALKFLPYPVVSGFANAVGALLVISVLPLALGHDRVGRLLQLPQWLHDLKPGAIAVALAATLAGWAVGRWRPRAPAVVVALLVGTAVHQGLASAGLGGLLGPTLPLGGSGRPDGPNLAAMAASWQLGWDYGLAILKAGLVTAVLNSLFAMVNSARMSEATDPPLEGDRLLRSQAAGNLAAGLAGGLPVSVVGSVTAPLRRAAAIPGPAHALWALATVAALLVLLFGLGHDLLRELPMAAMAASVFLGAKALFDGATPGYVRLALRPGPARREALGHLALGAPVVAVALLHSLALALLVGAIAALVLLTVELRRGVVVARSDLAVHRSRRVRTEAQSQLLKAAGTRVRILELGHWLYFGTVDDLADALQPPASETGQGAARHWLVLDLRRVAGIDLTATRALAQAAERLSAQGTRLVLAGLVAGDQRRGPLELMQAMGQNPALDLRPTLDDALESLEDELLSAAHEPVADVAVHLLPGMEARWAPRLDPYLARRALSAGETVFSLGDEADAMYMLTSGRVRLWVPSRTGAEIRLLSFGPFVGFGELGLMDGGCRSAHARADQAGELLVLTRSALARMADEDPPLHAAVLRAITLRLAIRLRDTTAQLGAAW